ncbi:hypothetical protein BST97_04740 [Nonlabens spongiae]|uniref:ABC transporter n=1 Tax=Nonlabens spongiae TaxID=331648 RepID=A0A1W6MI98_9FLAO|nr:DUF808 family protein [Nonlabens spongiae]ARN77344.1 hypothetical protein BST97_04740 [Nonlabens spongiae]
MASSFFALFDDISVLMDDVASMSKVATKKTAGILADDLAVNADKASGFVSKRELPVLWKIAKGSLLNKAIILPITFLLSAFLPVAIIVILVIGGIYLAFEGAEKIWEYLFKKKENKQEVKHVKLTPEEVLEQEKEKIKSAILVDFILSVEIVIIALGTVLEEPLEVQIAVTTVVALLATVGVYGIVALLVRMDDAGLRLIAAADGKETLGSKIGQGMVFVLPWIVKGLAILGTLAMILVAGGIFVHNIHFFEEINPGMPSMLWEFLVGLVVGLIAFLLFSLVMKLLGKKH